MLIEIDETFLFRVLKDRCESQDERIAELEAELASRTPKFERQGGTVGGFQPPIEVNADNLRTRESKLAAATMIQRANETYDLLSSRHKEQQP